MKEHTRVSHPPGSPRGGPARDLGRVRHDRAGALRRHQHQGDPPALPRGPARCDRMVHPVRPGEAVSWRTARHPLLPRATSRRNARELATFMRREIIDGGEDPANLVLDDREQAVVAFGRQLAANANRVSDALYGAAHVLQPRPDRRPDGLRRANDRQQCLQQRAPDRPGRLLNTYRIQPEQILA